MYIAELVIYVLKKDQTLVTKPQHIDLLTHQIPVLHELWFGVV